MKNSTLIIVILSGVILWQNGFWIHLLRKAGVGYRVVGELHNTDYIMNNGFWIGVYPGMTSEMNAWMIKCIKEFCTTHLKNND